MTLQEAFGEIADHRRGAAQRHNLQDMIVMAICAVLCGADSWVDVADWCEDEEAWLGTFLKLTHGTPSHHTFCRVFRVLDATVFERGFRQWISCVVGVSSLRRRRKLADRRPEYRTELLGLKPRQ